MKIVCSKNKRFSNVATRTTKRKQTNIWQAILYETENFCLRKTGPGQIRIEDLGRPKHIHYLQAKLTEKAWKFEFIMNQDTSDSTDFVKLVVNPKKKPTFQFDNPCYSQA